MDRLLSECLWGRAWWAGSTEGVQGYLVPRDALWGWGRGRRHLGWAKHLSFLAACRLPLGRGWGAHVLWLFILTTPVILYSWHRYWRTHWPHTHVHTNTHACFVCFALGFDPFLQSVLHHDAIGTLVPIPLFNY